VQFEALRFWGNGNCPVEFAGVGLFQPAPPLDAVEDPLFEVEALLVFDPCELPEVCVEPDCDETFDPDPVCPGFVSPPVWETQAAKATEASTHEEKV
jgi:hypothetical protein